MNQVSIEFKKLSKRYPGSEKHALKDLCIRVNSGEVYGFLGPNGAGKSTTIRLLMNFLQPTSGTALINGNDIVNDSQAIRASIGYLSGDAAMYPKMTGLEYLEYMGELQAGKADRKVIDKLANRLNADLSRKLQNLSRGNRQKIALMQAFMHEPAVLILDEPTSGLDPLVQEVFYELIGEAKARGATVFMSSHILSEVQKVCDRVGIIREGQLVSENYISDLTAEAAQTFDIVFAEKVPLSELRKIDGLKIQSHHGNNVTIHMRGKLKVLFKTLAKYDVTKIDARALDLEEMFMQFYEDDKK